MSYDSLNQALVLPYSTHFSSLPQSNILQPYSPGFVNGFPIMASEHLSQPCSELVRIFASTQQMSISSSSDSAMQIEKDYTVISWEQLKRMIYDAPPSRLESGLLPDGRAFAQKTAKRDTYFLFTSKLAYILYFVHYYFSRINLDRDKTMRKMMIEDSVVPVEMLVQAPRLASIGTTQTNLEAAVDNSNLLCLVELTNGKKGVKRIDGYPGLPISTSSQISDSLESGKSDFVENVYLKMNQQSILNVEPSVSYSLKFANSQVSNILEAQSPYARTSFVRNNNNNNACDANILLRNFPSMSSVMPELNCTSPGRSMDDHNFRTMSSSPVVSSTCVVSSEHQNVITNTSNVFENLSPPSSGVTALLFSVQSPLTPQTLFPTYASDYPAHLRAPTCGYSPVFSSHLIGRTIRPMQQNMPINTMAAAMAAASFENNPMMYTNLVGGPASQPGFKWFCSPFGERTRLGQATLPFSQMHSPFYRTVHADHSLMLGSPTLTTPHQMAAAIAAIHQQAAVFAAVDRPYQHLNPSKAKQNPQIYQHQVNIFPSRYEKTNYFPYRSQFYHVNVPVATSRSANLTPSSQQYVLNETFIPVSVHNYVSLASPCSESPMNFQGLNLVDSRSFSLESSISSCLEDTGNLTSLQSLPLQYEISHSAAIVTEIPLSREDYTTHSDSLHRHYSDSPTYLRPVISDNRQVMPNIFQKLNGFASSVDKSSALITIAIAEDGKNVSDKVLHASSNIESFTPQALRSSRNRNRWQTKLQMKPTCVAVSTIPSIEQQSLNEYSMPTNFSYEDKLKDIN